jgi:enoyl-CoA hydratase
MITLTMKAPGKNALSTELMTWLIERLEAARGEAVFLTGEGDAFSAGLNLKEVASLDRDGMSRFLGTLERMVHTLFHHAGPTVAWINGHAIAGGCVLAAACDIRFMSGGTIGLSELLVGVPFPGVPLEIMRYALGPATRRFVLTSQLLSPPDALAAGLIDQVTEPEALLETALAEAERLSRITPDVYEFTKLQLQGPARERIDALRQSDDEASTRMWASPAVQEAISGFMDGLKR